MNILVIGANGQIAQHFIKKIAQTEHNAVAMIRKEEQVDMLKASGANKVVVADLEKDFSHAFDGIDAVVFAAGSGGHTGADKTVMIDLWGAIKAIDETVKHNINRFVMISAMSTDDPDAGPESMRHYLVAKKLADDHLKSTNLKYTIVRPGLLTNDAMTGKVNLQEKISDYGDRAITREDVAAVLAEVIDKENTFKRTFELLNGDVPISEAVNNFS